jgi:hypothetical protein
VRSRLGNGLQLGQCVAGIGVLLLGLTGTALYARVVHQVYPIQQWLFWPLATLWGWMAVFSLACASFGQWVLIRVLRLRGLPALESAVLAMATGVVAFAMAMYLAGALAWYGPVWALALPAAMLMLGAGDGWRLARRLLEQIRAPQRRGLFVLALSAAGVVCVAVIYLGAMTPDALNYDSTWYHLVVAQDYARAGRIVAFPADYNKNYPQLTGLINTWGWTLPGLNQPLRWMLALHLEFGLLLWTLAGVASGIRVLVADPKLRGSWASFFLFPAIFVYDHNLGGAADHICAFFAVPILLATLRVCSSFSRGDSVLLGITCAGCLLAKYQATYLIAPVAAVVGVHWLRLLAEHRFPILAPDGVPRLPVRQLVWSPILTGAVGLALVSPHFLRLWIFHHNPVYPFLQQVFRASTPTLPNAAFMFEQTATDPNWRPIGTLGEKLWHASKLFVTFSFEPHYSFTNNVPMFGSLFTLLLPLILFVRERSRILIAAVLASGAVLIWGMVYNVDRNLQVFMPIMACTTAAILIKAWRLGWSARVGLAPLVALQVIWGADALVYNEYSRIQSAFDLIRSGFENRAQSRFDGYRGSFREISAALPANARVLLHTSHLSLGIDREVYFDWLGYQGLIGYDALHTPAELFAYFRSLGITHLLYEPGNRPAATKQEEILWHALIGSARSMGNFSGHTLLAMPVTSPAPEPPYNVIAIGLHDYANGIYPIEAMNTDEYLPRALQKFAKPREAMPGAVELKPEILVHVNAVLLGPNARGELQTTLVRQHFKQVATLSGRFSLYLRGR